MCLTIQYDRERGKLVGALIVDLDTEVYAITSSGGVIRTLAREVRKAKRQTMGVRLMNLSEGDSLVAIARNAAAEQVEDAVLGTAGPAGPGTPGSNGGSSNGPRLTRRRWLLVTATSGPGSSTASPAESPPGSGDGNASLAPPQHVGPPAPAGPAAPAVRRRGPARRTPGGRRPPVGRRGWRRCS